VYLFEVSRKAVQDLVLLQDPSPRAVRDSPRTTSSTRTKGAVDVLPEQPAAGQESPAPIDHPVRIEVRSRAECKEDAFLEALSPPNEGPARKVIIDIHGNLVGGKAIWEQTAAVLVEETTNVPLAMGSMCLDGDPRRQQEPELLRELCGSPYVHLLFRDRHHHNRVLVDGKTRLATGMLWGLLELALRERPGPNGAMPRIHGLVHSWNDPALYAFESVRWKRNVLEPQPNMYEELENGLAIPAQPQVAMVREAGSPLPEDRDFNAYRPLLGIEYFEHRDAA
jgi:hypothetical protein